MLWNFVMWEQSLLSELVHVFAVIFKLGYFFSNWHCHSTLACIELQIYWGKTHKHSKSIITHAKDYQYSLWIMSKGKDPWEHHLSPMPYESDTKCHHHLWIQELLTTSQIEIYKYFIKISKVYSSEIFTFYGHVELQ